MEAKDILKKAAANKQEKPTKGHTPILKVADDIKALASEIRRAKDALDSADAEFSMLSADMIERIEADRAAFIRDEGYTPSIRVPDNDNKSILITYSSNHRKIDSTQEDTLKGIVGDEAFDTYFSIKNTIVVKADISEENLNKLIDLVGDDLEVFFDVEQTIKVNSRYEQEKLMAFTKGQRENLNEIVKAYKPSIKVR
jgi:hypothetical protein